MGGQTIVPISTNSPQSSNRGTSAEPVGPRPTIITGSIDAAQVVETEQEETGAAAVFVSVDSEPAKVGQTISTISTNSPQSSNRGTIFEPVGPRPKIITGSIDAAHVVETEQVETGAAAVLVSVDTEPANAGQTIVPISRNSPQSSNRGMSAE